MTPLVSIVTPSYNQGAYLEQTIRSVLAQDYEPVEYLIVDGASTDNSVEIIQDYAASRSDRIAWWVSEPDSGQAEAINKGLKRAQGEVVAWLNSDDLYLPGAISQGMAALQTNPTLGLVFGDAITIDAGGRPLNKLVFPTRVSAEWELAELLRFHIICQPAVFMRRTILEQAGYLDPDYHYMLDHNLWIRMARLAPIQYVSSGSECHSGLRGETRLVTSWAAARHHPAAKNVAQAENFGRETLSLLAWMEVQPDIGPMIKRDRRRVLGGAYRLNGRYLLDGGLPGAALKSYWRALRYWPGFALKHWRRIAYAFISLTGLNGAIKPLDRLRGEFASRHNNRLVTELRAQLCTAKGDPFIWPGLDLTPVDAA